MKVPRQDVEYSRRFTESSSVEREKRPYVFYHIVGGRRQDALFLYQKPFVESDGELLRIDGVLHTFQSIRTLEHPCRFWYDNF